MKILLLLSSLALASCISQTPSYYDSYSRSAVIYRQPSPAHVAATRGWGAPANRSINAYTCGDRVGYRGTPYRTTARNAWKNYGPQNYTSYSPGIRNHQRAYVKYGNIQRWGSYLSKSIR